MAEIRCLLTEAAAISRHEPAIVMADRRLLYHDVEERALFAQTNLRRASCGPGSRVAIWMDNDWRQLVLLPAIMRLGAVAVPVSARWPAALVTEQIRRIGCGFVIADNARRAALSECGAKLLDCDETLARTDEIPPREIRIPLAQPAAIVFTSGSSGKPRAALLSYGNLYYNALGANQNLKLASHDCWLLTLPLCHVGGLGILFRCLLSGATMAVPGRGEAIGDAQARYHATHLSLVGAQLHRLLHAEMLPPSFASVKAILLGGGAISPALLLEAHRRKLPVYPSYGLTEMASQVTAVAPATPPAKRETSGRLLRHRNLRIAVDGEILVSGETLFAGYVDETGVHSAADADGWFHTGDLGALDADGYLTVHGRKDFMFISGGENIQPEEIEQVLSRVTGVKQALVVPVEDGEFGQRPAAFLHMAGAMPSASTLSARLGEWLPKFKLPVAYFPWPAKSDGELAKPDRRRMAELAAKMWKK